MAKHAVSFLAVHFKRILHSSVEPKLCSHAINQGKRDLTVRSLIKWLFERYCGHKLAFVLLIGIVIRLILMPISAHPLDMFIWYQESLEIAKNGPLTVQVFPPLNGYFGLIPVAYAYDGLSKVFGSGAISMSSMPAALSFYPHIVQAVPGALFDTVLKLPLLFSDVLVALVLYRVAKEITANQGLAVAAAAMWFLNPFVIWISAGWGMWDSFAALFSLASAYFLLKKKFFFSSVFLVFGIVTKLYPVVFLLPFTFYIARLPPENRWKSIREFYAVIVASTLFLVVFFSGGLVNFFATWLVPNAQFTSNLFVNPVAFGLTWWSLPALFQLTNTPIGLPLTFGVSAVLVISAMMLSGWRVRKMTFKKPETDMLVAMLFCMITLFLSFRLVLEQWIIAILPLTVLLSVMGMARKRVYWGISGVALLYSVLNCPLPFFFLPLYSSIGDQLVKMVYAIWMIESVRIVLLAGLGAAFSVLVLLALIKASRLSKMED
jgi:hypothetical protein